VALPSLSPYSNKVLISGARRWETANTYLHDIYATRNVLINDEYLMTLTIFVIELVYSMTKLVASSCLIRDGALVRRTVTENRINVTKQ
jgi:hypothetical protein